MRADVKKNFFPNVGDIFDLTIPWPSTVQRIVGSCETTVEARRESDLTTEEVFEQCLSGTLKELYRIVTFDTHHVVVFGGERWVYDILGKSIKFAGVFTIPDEC